MLNTRLLSVVCSGVLTLALCTSAHTALQGRFPATPGGTDFQAYYDDVQDITWLADASLASSNTFGLPVFTSLGVHPLDSSGVDGVISLDGTMTFFGALYWLDAMNASSYLGVDDWRLPETDQPDPDCSVHVFVDSVIPLQGFGAGCTVSEMGHLYNIDGISTTAPGPFANIKPVEYWSGTEYIYGAAPHIMWDFVFGSGHQGWENKTNGGGLQSWAVRSGDILPRCDLNNNGKVDSGDLLQVMRMVLGNIADNLDCDLDNGGLGDGVISTADVVIVSRMVLGVIPAINN